MWYRALQILLPLIMPIFQFRVVGKEDVPTTEGVILAANHVSYLDPLFIGAALVEHQLHFMAKEELFRFPFFGAVLRRLYTVPVRRGQVDYAAIRQSLRLLKEGEIVAVFPEGTRGDGKALQEAEEGIGFLAARSGCPIIPVYVQGSGKVLPRDKRIPRVHPVTVHFGHPLRLGGETPHKETRRDHRRLTEEVMKGIAELKARSHSPGA